jgi:archaellum component FlaC
MNNNKASLDEIIKLEASLLQRLAKMDECFNEQELNYEKINSYIDGEKYDFYIQIEDNLKEISIDDSLIKKISFKIKDLLREAERFNIADNQKLISLICDSLEFINSITLSERLKKLLKFHEKEINNIYLAQIDYFEKARSKLISDFKEINCGYFKKDITKFLYALDFGRLSENNYEALKMLSESILNLEKDTFHDHNNIQNKCFDFICFINEIEDEINDILDDVKENVEEKINELDQIKENLNTLLADFEYDLHNSTIELLKKNKKFLVELQSGNIIKYVIIRDFKSAIDEFEMTFKYWIYDDGELGLLGSFLDILE